MMKKILLIILLLASSNVFGANKETVRQRLNKNIESVGSLNGFTLEETVAALSSIFAQNKNYINFIIIHKPKKTTQPAPPPQQNPNQPFPNNGLPFPPPAFQPVAAQVDPTPKIHGLNMKLKNITGHQLLELITMSLDKPIDYVVMDWGVAFYHAERKDNVMLFTRVFRVRPNLFSRGLDLPSRSNLGGVTGNSRANMGQSGGSSSMGFNPNMGNFGRFNRPNYRRR